MMLFEWQTGYLAGIIDGEGWIGIMTDANHSRPCVTVTSTNPILGRTLYEITKVGMVYETKRKGTRCRDQFIWKVQSMMEIVELLKKVSPYLLLKRKQAHLLISFCERKT